MQIKAQLMQEQLKKRIRPLYLFQGSNYYLMHEAYSAIKKKIIEELEPEIKRITLTKSEDWSLALEEADSLSLFSETLLLDLSYDKKKLDVSAKSSLLSLLKKAGQDTFILLRAPELSLKELQPFSADTEAMVLVANPFSPEESKKWIRNEVQKRGQRISSQAVEFIWRFSEGNMLATAQSVEKLLLSHEGAEITAEEALETLSDQSDHGVFELIEACLLGKTDKAIQVIRQAQQSKVEPTLILWILTQELRLLTQLLSCADSPQTLQQKATELKIWSSRLNSYRQAIKRLSPGFMNTLLRRAHELDFWIKGGAKIQSAWQGLESLALSLTKGLT